MFAFPVLLGDIGGTNARFALLSGPQGTVELLPRALTAATPSPVEAIVAALAAATGAAPRSAIIAVATRVDSPASGLPMRIGPLTPPRSAGRWASGASCSSMTTHP